MKSLKTYVETIVVLASNCRTVIILGNFNSFSCVFNHYRNPNAKLDVRIIL